MLCRVEGCSQCPGAKCINVHCITSNSSFPFLHWIDVQVGSSSLLREFVTSAIVSGKCIGTYHRLIAEHPPKADNCSICHGPAGRFVWLLLSDPQSAVQAIQGHHMIHLEQDSMWQSCSAQLCCDVRFSLRGPPLIALVLDTNLTSSISTRDEQQLRLLSSVQHLHSFLLWGGLYDGVHPFCFCRKELLNYFWWFTTRQ